MHAFQLLVVHIVVLGVLLDSRYLCQPVSLLGRKRAAQGFREEGPENRGGAKYFYHIFPNHRLPILRSYPPLSCLITSDADVISYSEQISSKKSRSCGS
jgi:hypothetical protein